MELTGHNSAECYDYDDDGIILPLHFDRNQVLPVGEGGGREGWRRGGGQGWRGGGVEGWRGGGVEEER
jgi:hypothetical protein